MQSLSLKVKVLTSLKMVGTCRNSGQSGFYIVVVPCCVCRFAYTVPSVSTFLSACFGFSYLCLDVFVLPFLLNTPFF